MYIILILLYKTLKYFKLNMYNFLIKICLINFDFIGRLYNFNNYELIKRFITVALSDILLWYYFDYDKTLIIYFDLTWALTIVLLNLCHLESQMKKIIYSESYRYLLTQILSKQPFETTCHNCKKQLIITENNIPFQDEEIIQIHPSINGIFMTNPKHLINLHRKKEYKKLLQDCHDSFRIYCKECWEQLDTINTSGIRVDDKTD